MSYYNKDFYKEDRWYHAYLYIVTVTSILSLVITWMTGWNLYSIVIICGMMAIMSFIAFIAEFTVMGATATAGGFFWAAVTCYIIAHYLPVIPVS